MGLMDDLKNNAPAIDGASHEGVVQALLTSFQSQGGLGALVNTFHERGLGGVISSWISTGPNQSVSSNQIEQVLGNDRISAIAAKFGLPATAITETLARALPSMIDKMTPNGQLQHDSGR